MLELPIRPSESRSLVDRIREWSSILECGSYNEKSIYVREVNRRYDSLANCSNAEDLVELRLLRSRWAKKLAQVLMGSDRVATAIELSQLCTLLGSLRTLIRSKAVKSLIAMQMQIGNSKSNIAVAMLLAEHTLPEDARIGLRALGAHSDWFLRLGPERISKFRPSRKTAGFDHSSWLTQSEMTKVDLVEGNPDRIRVRGLELHSGDIGIVELNHPGDGLLESFLEQPGVAPHAMLYVTRRVLDPKSNETLFQPSAMEIYEGGWRCLPITTALHPEFSWYSEWVRPRIDGQPLPVDVGEKLSAAIDTMETFSFDFQARRIPTGGYFPSEFGGSSASCTNLLRVPFERAGIDGLPYPITKIVPNAARNLAILGIPGMAGIHTPTNILNDSGFQKIGIIDNGEPELGYAQAIVVGRPELADTFGGWMSQRALQLENLPNWKSVKNWKSAWEALRIRIGQSEKPVGQALRRLLNVDDDEVPKSVSDTTIAFYLRSDMEAGHVIMNRVLPFVEALFEYESELHSLSQLRASTEIVNLVRHGLLESALHKENWYRIDSQS